jgi:YidC/Oxa1 family membrane protein insertase
MEMNKVEKLVSLLLGAVLAWYVFIEMPRQSQEKADAVKASREEAEIANPQPALESAAPKPTQQAPSANEKEKDAAPKSVTPSIPEKKLVLENNDVKLELSTWGATVKKVVLKGYSRDIGEISEDNPPVVLDFSSSPLGEIAGSKDLAANEPYEATQVASNEVVFANTKAKRTVRLLPDYKIEYCDEFVSAGNAASLSLGVMTMGQSKNDLLSVDSCVVNAKGKQEPIHHCEGDSPLKAFLVGGLSGGCSGSSSAAGMPERQVIAVNGAQKWIAVKNRFFVAALCACDVANNGFEAEIARDTSSADYRPSSVAIRANFAGEASKRNAVFYVGPKKQALLWDLGMKDVMEFGMWRWLCYPIVAVLNFFNGIIPNFGVAIILLTMLVRLIFWPLTHKSTVGMKKMQELQPKMKELQAKFKDNPQRLQQETWALYKAEKVNPMSSCLPMLIQIPVFIALFNVLRSAVELRYAPFLWISDLSEPEGLFAAYLPFGGLNILPILMAVSTGLQSAFTPTSGDKSQQRMMTVFMPVMMLFMFYSFPSALSLYWFVPNLFSIVQMYLIRRKASAGEAAVMPEVIDPPVTRQMRRHG